MKRYVIDASIAVKWYSTSGEDDFEKADQLLQMYEDRECSLMAPSLIVYELSNALRFNPNLEVKDIQRAIANFFALEIGLEEPSEYVAVSVALAFKYSLTVYDAVYAALAQVSGIPLITADYKFYAKAKRLPLIEPLRDLKL